MVTVLTLAGFANLLAQSTDEEAIKQVVRSETELYYKHDWATWKASFVQSDKLTRNMAVPGGYGHAKGWKSFVVRTLQEIAKNTKPVEYKQLANSNYVININGDTATIVYDHAMDFSN